MLTKNISFKNKALQIVKIVVLIVVLWFSLELIDFGASFAYYDYCDMKANYWRSNNAYYDSILDIYYDLTCLLFGISLAVVAVFSLIHVFKPAWKPRRLKSFSRDQYKTMAVVSGSLLLYVLLLILLLRKFILNIDYGAEEHPSSGYLFHTMGNLEILALLFVESLFFSLHGLRKEKRMLKRRRPETMVKTGNSLPRQTVKNSCDIDDQSSEQPDLAGAGTREE